MNYYRSLFEAISLVFARWRHCCI